MGDGGSRPVPDPTVLTTAALVREIAGVDEKIRALKELTESDLEGLEAVIAEKFNTVDTQFNLIERQRVESKEDSGDALAAALAAAKEAVTKNEESTKEQLAQLKITFDTAITAVTATVTDVRDRVGKIEALKLGGEESRAGLYAALAGAVAILAIVVVLANVLSNR